MSSAGRRCGVRARGTTKPVAMIAQPTGTHIWIAADVKDLRRGFTGLSATIQTALKENPFSGHVFVFRGRRGDLIKLLWFDGDGLCLFSKRLERGRFNWPQATDSTALLTRATTFDAAGRYCPADRCTLSRMTRVDAILPDLNVLNLNAKALVIEKHTALISHQTKSKVCSCSS